MLGTKRLFDENPYAETFKSKVVSIGNDYIVLDKTLFYPESGNQDCDKGYINGIAVTSVLYEDNDSNGYISFDSVIRHYIDVSTFELNQEVTGVIDLNARLLTMRLHSASHLVEYIISSLPGFQNVEGSFVNHKKDRTDFRFTIVPTSTDLQVIESQVNMLIDSCKTIETTVSDGIKRWVCGEVKMICCGTHVKNTKEIGHVSLKRKNKGRGIIRVETSLID